METGGNSMLEYAFVVLFTAMFSSSPLSPA